MEDASILFCFSELQWARERNSSKFINSVCTFPQKVSPALPYSLPRLRIHGFMNPRQYTSWQRGILSFFFFYLYTYVIITYFLPSRYVTNRPSRSVPVD
jgi:hypothetical protein